MNTELALDNADMERNVLRAPILPEGPRPAVLSPLPTCPCGRNRRSITAAPTEDHCGQQWLSKL